MMKTLVMIISVILVCCKSAKISFDMHNNNRHMMLGRGTLRGNGASRPRERHRLISTRITKLQHSDHNQNYDSWHQQSSRNSLADDIDMAATDRDRLAVLCSKVISFLLSDSSSPSYKFVSLIPDDDIAMNPNVLRCLRMDLPVDLLGATNAIFRRNSVRLIKEYPAVVVEFIERASLVGKLNLIELVLGRYGDLLPRKQLRFAGIKALDARQYAAAAMLKEFGVPIDLQPTLQSVVLDRPESLISMINLGLASTDEAYAAISFAEDQGFDVGPVKSALIQTIQSRLIRSTSSGDGAFQHLNYYRYPGSEDPLMYACETGDALLFDQLFRLHNSKSFFDLNVFTSTIKNTEIAREIARGEGVNFEHFEDSKYLNAAISHGHNDILVRLLKSFNYSPKTLQIAFDHARDDSGNKKAAIVIRDFMQAESDFIMRQHIQINTSAEVARFLQMGVRAPNMAFLDAVRNQNNPVQGLLMISVLLHEFNIDPVDHGGYLALEWLCLKQGRPFQDMFLRLLASMYPGYDDAEATGQLLSLSQRMIDAGNYNLFRVAVRALIDRGLSLDRLVEISEQEGNLIAVKNLKNIRQQILDSKN